MEKGFKSILARFLLHKLRIWDIRSSFGVDYFIANSQFIARRINKVYRRHAEVIYPGVAVTDFQLCENKEDFYLTASRMVPYKRIDLIVEAFAKMPHKKLVVIGDGPEFKKIKALATENICLLGYQSFDVLKEYMQKARAFVFAAEEDFGIVPVEAQACGTPVIAYGKGGCLETVVEGKSGVFFYEQSVRALCDAVDQFEKSKALSLASEIRAHAEQFSSERFRAQIRKFVDEKIEEFNLSRSMKSA